MYSVRVTSPFIQQIAAINIIFRHENHSLDVCDFAQVSRPSCRLGVAVRERVWLWIRYGNGQLVLSRI